MQLSFTVGGTEKIQGTFFPSVKSHNPNKSEIIERGDHSRKNQKSKRDIHSKMSSFFERKRQSQSFDHSFELVDTTAILTDPSNLVSRPVNVQREQQRLSKL